MENKDIGLSSIGVQANVAATLCYALGWVTGLVFILIEKDNKFIKFHAAQSIVLFGALNVLQIVLRVMLIMSGVLSDLISQLLGYAMLILWIVLLVKAYQGTRFKLPVVGDIAEQIANK